VAVTALFTHTALMGLVFVTRQAGWIGFLELSIKVARFTSSDTVNTYQGETGDIVLEKQLHVPALLVMAIAAILSEFIFVHIDCTMAGDAFRLFEIIHLHGSMAGAAD
jgi:hypothetical protein